jgi:hypothetical protein
MDAVAAAVVEMKCRLEILMEARIGCTRSVIEKMQRQQLARRAPLRQ